MAKFRQNGFVLALAAGLVLALAVGIVYAVASGSRRVVGYADSLDAAHETIQAATVARGQLELAAFEVALLAAGVGVDMAALDAALDEASEAAASLATTAPLVAQSEKAAPGLAAASARFISATEGVIASLRDRIPVARDAFAAPFDELIGGLSETRDRLSAATGTAGRSNAWTTAIAGFLAVFLVPAGVITVFYVLDRRRRRQHELQLALQVEDAAQASREQFLATVSHELQRPLTGIRGIANLVSGDESLMGQPRIADLHSLLEWELDDMTGLVDDLLTASRIESRSLDYAFVEVDVKAETASLVESASRRDSSIYVAMDDGFVHADRRRFRQIVRTLLTNALRYGGPNIEIKGQADAETYTIMVVDDGAGVPRGVDLFSRFAHGGEDASQSVGLGLSNVMALAIGMGGTAFHNREDGLTRFGFRLPRVTAALQAVQDEPAAAEDATRAAS